MQAYCAICKADTDHEHTLNHEGEHVLTCQTPTTLVKACVQCVGDEDHRTNEAGDELHGETEYRLHQIDPAHAVADPYDGICKHFIKLPASFDMADVAAYLNDHKAVNDKSGLPPPACEHRFSTVAPKVSDSVCDRCGATHGELFR